MRLLVLLRGCPGVGKSTFIKENNLEQYVVSPDQLRIIYSGIDTDKNNIPYISQRSNKRIWRLIYDEILPYKMNEGQLIIMDATHCNIDAIKAYRKLIEKYAYRLKIIDFNEGGTLEEILKRNNSRELYKRVPKDIIEASYEKYNLSKNETIITKNLITKEYFLKMLEPNFNKDLSKYENIFFIGDIHSVSYALKSFFEHHPYSENDFYVFCGDYFDRGDDPVGTLNTLYALSDKPNVLFIRGNHDLHIDNYFRDGVIKTPAFKLTIEAIQKAGLEKDLKMFSKKFIDLTMFKYHKIKFVVTHAGVPFIPTSKTKSRDIIKGVGEYADINEIDNYFSNTCSEGHIFSIHGHRNMNYSESYWNADFTFNLCGDIELGGYLRVLQVNRHNFIELKYKHHLSYEEVIAFNKVRDLNNSKNIKVKELENGIKSYNFTREAFYRKEWDNLTVSARGLFLYKDNNVCARGYNKFFNIILDQNSRDISTEEYGDKYIDEVVDSLKYPVSIYNKENGFLGILSYNKETDHFFIASKTTNQGEHAEYFKEIIKTYLNDELKDFLKENNVTLLFEVIDPVNDPHTIKYDNKQLFLLECLNNDLNKEITKEFSELEKIAERFHFPIKKLHRIISDKDELKEYLIDIYENYNREGVVLEDINYNRWKFKTKYYKQQRKEFYKELERKQNENN